MIVMASIIRGKQPLPATWVEEGALKSVKAKCLLDLLSRNLLQTYKYFPSLYRSKPTDYRCRVKPRNADFDGLRDFLLT